MPNNAKLLALTAGLIASVACIANGIAQTQPAPTPPPPFQDKQTPPPPLVRDFQQMIENQKQQMRSRISWAVERIQDACREELRNFCSTVTPGEGRILLCMQAHEDKLGNQCELALFDASRHIRQAVHHVEQVGVGVHGPELEGRAEAAVDHVVARAGLDVERRVGEARVEGLAHPQERDSCVRHVGLRPCSRVGDWGAT